MGSFVVPLHVLLFKLLSLNGTEHADFIYRNIERLLPDDNTPILEVRADEGHLTEKLLQAGVKNLHVYEKRRRHSARLKEILSHYPGQGVMHAATLNEVLFQDCSVPAYNSSFLSDSLPFKLQSAWEDSPSMKLIASHKSGKVLLVALIHIAKNMMYCGMGRPQFILNIPAPTWNKFLQHPSQAKYNDYQLAGLLFPDFYEIEVLGTIPAPVYYNSGDHENFKIYKEEFLTVSLAPSKDLNKIISPEVLEEYLFFGTQTMNGKAKHESIIKTLERWQPGCGKDLVIFGVNCFTLFSDLSPKEALQIFSFWRSLPTYNSSLFMYEFQEYWKNCKH